MMLYSMYDRVALESSQPFVAKNDGIALRIFTVSLRDSPAPGDFRLYCLGDWSPEHMKITPLEAPREVFGASEDENG